MREEEIRELEEKLNELENKTKRRTRSEYQEKKRKESLEKSNNKKKSLDKIKNDDKKSFDDTEGDSFELTSKKKNRKLSFHKVFNVISFIFLLTCVVVYGTRFIFLYLENNKTEKTKQIADTIKDDHAGKAYFKNISGDYYFSGTEASNYLKYSNMIWRIIKVDSSGNVVISLEKPITLLNKGDLKFKNSNVANWLNSGEDEDTGYFQKLLNDVPQYLTYTKTCIDDDKDIKNITCKKKTSDVYITIPSLNDYVNTGGSKSFLNSGNYYYLINNDGDKTWCVDSDGKISTSDGSDIIGIKPVITVKKLATVISGKGSKEEPYIIEENEASFIGSYVKLDEDIWQVYDEDENNVKLSLDGYITSGGEEVLNKYSKSSYKFDVNEYGSLAWYLNNRYMNNLKYNNILEEFEIFNGVYTNNYKQTVKDKVKTKVGVLSIGNVIIDSEGSDYYFSTGLESDEKQVFICSENSKMTASSSANMIRIRPTISIKKSLILERGTKEKPYEVAYEN